jgi:hypothetical protein
VFAGAVVVETRRPSTRLADDFGAALRRRIVGATGQIAGFETDVMKHGLDDGDVFRLAAV